MNRKVAEAEKVERDAQREKAANEDDPLGGHPPLLSMNMLLQRIHGGMTKQLIVGMNGSRGPTMEIRNMETVQLHKSFRHLM